MINHKIEHYRRYPGIFEDRVYPDLVLPDIVECQGEFPVSLFYQTPSPLYRRRIGVLKISAVDPVKDFRQYYFHGRFPPEPSSFSVALIFLYSLSVRRISSMSRIVSAPIHNEGL